MLAATCGLDLNKIDVVDSVDTDMNTKIGLTGRSESNSKKKELNYIKFSVKNKIFGWIKFKYGKKIDDPNFDPI